MYEFHKDKKKYFDIQRRVTEEYIYPFVREFISLGPDTKVLEIGCAEAGVLKYFLDQDCICTGIELSPSRVEWANKFLEKEIQTGRAKIVNQNIFDVPDDDFFKAAFDLIILKDVIEHIPHKDLFLSKLKSMLKPGGRIFIAFPPWKMPFGGHQQVCQNNILNKLPWIHLLPKGIYRWLLSTFGESPKAIHELMELRDTRLTLDEFENLMHAQSIQILKKIYWIVNPIYQYKFGIKPRKYANSPGFLKDFRTSCLYAIVEKEN